jgi:cyclase
MAAGLFELAPGVYAWVGGDGQAEAPNAGAVIDADGITVIDALLTPADAAPFVEALAGFERPIRRLVLTSSHIDRTGGSTAFPFAAVYGTPQTNAHLEQPPNVTGYRLLYPDHADAFDDGFATRRVTHIVDAPAQLTPAVALIPTGGQSAENLVAVVAGAGVWFGGAMVSNGVTPLAFDGDPAQWADELDRLTDLGATVVPGYGPIAAAHEVAQIAAYLRACVDAQGDPASMPAGPWDSWTDRDRDGVNVERAAMLASGNAETPPSMLRRLGLG